MSSDIGYVSVFWYALLLVFIRVYTELPDDYPHDDQSM